MLAFPQLAVALQSCVAVLFELPPQRPALVDGGDGGCSSGRPWRTYLSGPGPFSQDQVPVEGGSRYAERPGDFLPGAATVQSGKHLQSEFERIRFHLGSVAPLSLAVRVPPNTGLAVR